MKNATDNAIEKKMKKETCMQLKRMKNTQTKTNMKIPPRIPTIIPNTLTNELLPLEPEPELPALPEPDVDDVVVVVNSMGETTQPEVSEFISIPRGQKAHPFEV